VGKNTAEPDRRRKIEEARRKQQSSERRRTYLAVGGAAVAAIALIAGALFIDNDGRKGPDADKTPLATFGVAKEAAGCDEIEHADPIPKGGEHKGGVLSWPAIPPLGGDHRGVTLRNLNNFYSRDDNPSPEAAVHNMEHGIVMVWYDKTTSDEEIEVLKNVAANSSKRTMVMPWVRDNFPEGKPVVLTAWGHRQRCGKVSGAVIQEFADLYQDGKDAPEKGAAV
jgi:hypothetical protein